MVQESAKPDPGLPPRYAAVSWLAAGAFGQVYQAQLTDGRAAAVKVLAPELATRPELAWQFAAEYRRLARLDHPAFPPAFEEGRTEAGCPFYAMALVEGEGLAAGPRPASEVRALVGQVAAALGYLHGLGVVHGDLKPENLLVAGGGQVHVLDVGLMAEVGRAREAIAGTLEYLAPEALRRAPVDPRMDLYALGVLAYELWTGLKPFTGDPSALVKAHLSLPPPPLAPHTPDRDPALEQLVLALLAKAPADRPATALAVQRALGLAPAGALEPPPGLQAGLLLGREEALAAWQATLAAGAGWLVLAGEPGLGKSRMLDECRVAAQLAGRTWVGARATGAADAPGAPLRAIVAQALTAARLEPTPELAAWLVGTVPEQLAALEPASRKAAMHAAATAGLLQAASSLGGLTVGLDDWHAADEASREGLAAWARSASGPIAWVVTSLPGEGAPELAGSYVARLEPLTSSEATELLALRLGGLAPPTLAEALVGASQGSPLWLDSLLEQAHASGALAHVAGQWRYDAPSEPAPGAAGGLVALWRSRLAGASHAERRLAGVAALAMRAGELSVASLVEAAGLEAAEGFAALEALVRRGLLLEQGGLARLAMPGAATVLGEGLEPERREAAAARLAASLLGEPVAAAAPERLAELPLERLLKAAWLALATPASARGEGAMRLAVATAQRLLALAAPREALKLLEAAEPALAASPATTQLPYLSVRADAERWLDRIGEAIAHGEAALALAHATQDSRHEARLLIGLAKCQQMQGAYAPALALLDRAAGLARTAAAPELEARGLIAEARLRLFGGDSAAAVACCQQARQLLGDAATPARQALCAEALVLEGALVAQADPARSPEALALIARALALSERLGDRLNEGRAYENLGNVHLAAGDLAPAARAFERAGTLYEQLGSSTDALGAWLNQAIVAGDLGEAEPAATLAGEVVRRARLAGRRFFAAAAEAVVGQAAWRAGQVAEAREPLDRALETALAIGNRYLEEHVRLTRLEALVALGEQQAARVEADSLAALVAAAAAGAAAARLAALRAELCRQAGDAPGALLLAQEAAQGPHPLAAHLAWQVLASLALEAERGDEALAHARQAGAIARTWQAPWHEAADTWLEARALALQGEPGAALARVQIGLALPASNPYARTGLALLWVELEPGGAAREALELALQALRPGLLALEAAERQTLLEAQGLSAAWGRLEQPPTSAGGMLDARAFALAIGELALAEGEPAIARAALRGGMGLVGAERGYFLAYEDGSLREVVTSGLEYEVELSEGFSHSIAEEVLFSGTALYVADASENPAWREASSVMALGLKTVICLPVATPEQILGVLYLDRQAIDPVLLEADLAYLGAYTTAVAALVLRERALASARAEAHAANGRLELALALAAAPAAARRQVVLEALLEAAGAERAFWLARDPAGQWVPEARAGDLTEPAVISQGIAGWVHEQQTPLALLDVGAAEGWKARQSVQALGLRTVWCLPTQPGGLVYLDTGTLATADPHQPLAALAALLAIAHPL